MRKVTALNNYLRMYRKRGGFTQKELAFLLGCTHRSKTSRYELGVRLPTLETVIGLEVILGARLAQLFAGTYTKVREKIRSRAQELSREFDAKPTTEATKQKLNALEVVIHPEKVRDAA